MRRFMGWVLAGSILVAIAGSALPWPELSDHRTALSNGRELRVRHVSLGTNHVISFEPVWKRVLRWALPERWLTPLGPFQGQRFQTRGDSLVVWVETFDLNAGKIVANALRQPEAVFTDGTTFPGRNRSLGRATTDRLEFACFERGGARIGLRVRDGTNVIDFAVQNPWPVRPTRWTARPWPQTNHSRATEMVLREGAGISHFARPGSELPLTLQCRGLGEDTPGWMSWRVTAFDPWGNWTEQSWSRSMRGPSSVPLLPSGSDTWKLLVEGREYLSAGFVPAPTNRGVVVLPLTPRARALGVRFLLFAGPGCYQITDGRMASAANPPAHPSGVLTLGFIQLKDETHWGLNLTNAMPAILLVSDFEPGHAVLEARLRERIGADDGRIFTSLNRASAKGKVNGAKVIASLLTPRLAGMSTTNLEVELIHTPPAAEFFVPAPR